MADLDDLEKQLFSTAPPEYQSTQSPEEKYDDTVAVLHARQGDDVAFKELVDRYQDLVEKIINDTGRKAHYQGKMSDNVTPLEIFQLVIFGRDISGIGLGNNPQALIELEEKGYRSLPGSKYNEALGLKGNSVKNWLAKIAVWRTIHWLKHMRGAIGETVSLTPLTENEEEANLQEQAVLNAMGDVLKKLSDPGIEGLEIKDLVDRARQKLLSVRPDLVELFDDVVGGLAAGIPQAQIIQEIIQTRQGQVPSEDSEEVELPGTLQAGYIAQDIRKYILPILSEMVMV